MARDRRRPARLDQPRPVRRALPRPPSYDPDAFGRLSERFARFMGTAKFLMYMTALVAVWLAWNTFAPVDAQFDPRALNYTLLTLILSLQASYAAPLILLAQNRQDDRDRVQYEQDRARAERTVADTEYLARELAALRIAVGEVATRDFVRSELRALLEEVEAGRQRDAADRADRAEADRPTDRRPADRSDRSDQRADAADGRTNRRPDRPDRFHRSTA